MELAKDSVNKPKPVPYVCCQQVTQIYNFKQVRTGIGLQEFVI